MTTKELEALYIAHEPEIKASLINQHIFDEDLFQDTCLEICEYAQHNDIRNFPGIFIERYKQLLKRHGQRHLDIVPFDNDQLAALEIIDETQDVENIDQGIDYVHEQRSAEYKERLQKLLNRYSRHPQPGERDHKRACRILRLHLNGLSEREIARKERIIQPSVHQYIERTLERLKAITL